MNRLNARIRFWYEVCEASSSYLPIPDGRLIPPDREVFKHAISEQHAYCDIRDAICTPNRRKD